MKNYLQDEWVMPAYTRLEIYVDRVDGVSLHLDRADGRHLVLGADTTSFEGLSGAEAVDVLAILLDSLSEQLARL